MARINTPTITINCVDEGPRDGPVIVFSNSLGSNLSMWQAQADHFGREYRVVRYDHRGHGGSEVAPGPYDFRQLCDDVVALMDALDIPCAHFAGLSMGGMTALGLALDHAERLLSIASCNCVASYAPAALEVWDERIAGIEANGLESVLDGTLERWFTEPTRNAHPGQMADIRAMIAATPVEGYLACCAALKRLDYIDRLSTITLPTLFIAGTHGAGAPAEAMRDMHARVAGSRYVELDAAHISNIERPQEFNQAMANFLRSL